MSYTSAIDESAWLTALATHTAARTLGDAAPSDWNGDIGNVDLAKPVDYTTDWGKLIKTAKGAAHFSLRATIIYYIWLAQDKPLVTTGNDLPPITTEQITKVVPYVRLLIARYRVYRLVAATNMAFTYREADMLATTTVPTTSRHVDAASYLYQTLIVAGEMENLIADSGRMVMMQIVANAIHREQNEGHEWFTTDMGNASSPTAKALGVAGRDKARFKTHMATHGHDNGHHLSSITLDTVARLLCASTSATFPNGIRYMGVDLRAQEFSTVVDLGSAARHRYPAGVLGKSAMITGLAFAEAMIVHISSKALLVGHGPIAANLSAVLSAVRTANYSHDKVLEISNKLGPVLAFVYGFCEKAGIVEESSCLALANHAKRHLAEMASGASLASTFAKAIPHQQAVQGAIVAALVNLSGTVAAAADIDVGTAASPLAVATGMVTVTSAQINVTVGTRTAAQTTEAFYNNTA